jgi:phenylacetic acid degradation operon negative regulatory protein
VTVVDTGAPIAERAMAWGREPDISARSALVTILGDTVAPIGGTLWLADLVALARPFGFNERLVRTSLFRLAAEGWVDNERVGRRSRYSLTDYGRDETSAAERRIYHQRSATWDGTWTLVFLGPPAAGTDRADEPARHLRWRGFAPMADGVHARPNDHTGEARTLLDRLGVDPPPPVAAARFDGTGEAPVAGSPFRAESGLAEAEAAYRRFLDRYRPLGGAVDDLAPGEAFALRTMLVHDLRRARLQDPDLPPALLTDDWVGHRAFGSAADLYRSITDRAWAWVADVTGRTVTDQARVSSRFPLEGDRP